jgi:hypothetical protein
VGEINEPGHSQRASGVDQLLQVGFQRHSFDGRPFSFQSSRQPKRDVNLGRSVSC